MSGEEGIEAEAVPSSEPPSASEGFVLDEIEMRGFMRYLEKTDPPLRFPEKFTVITGRTGAGKSSILDAITFALYGSTARTDIQTVKIADICQPGGYVRLAFRQGDSRWEVRRGFTSRKESYLEVSRDGEAVQGTIHDKEQTIRDVVGLDYTGFRNSTFVRQEEMKELGSARGAERLSVFQKLFRLEIFERALERAKELDAQIGTDLRAKEAEIAARAEALQRLLPAREQLAGTWAEIASRGQEVTAQETRVRAAEESVKALEAQHEAWVRTKASRDDRVSRLEKLGRREAEVREQGTLVAKAQAELTSLEADVASLDDLREELEHLQARGQLHEQRQAAAQMAESMFDQAKRSHERRRDEIKDKIDQLHRKISGLRTEIDRETAFELLRDEGRLEERVARIGRELEWLADRPALVGELREDRSRADKALEHVRAKVQSIDQDSFVLSEFRRQVEELKQDLRREAEESHRTLEPLDDAKIEALRQLDAAPFSDADRRRLEDVRRQVQEKAARRKQADDLTTLLRRTGDVASLLAELEKDRQSLEADRVTLEGELARLGSEEATFQGARASLDQERTALDGLRRTLHVLEGQAKQLEVQVASLERDARKLEEAEHQREELRTRHELQEILVGRVFHKKGVVMFAVERLLPELEVEASKNLAELTDGRFSRIKLETFEEGRGHGIRIQVQGIDDRWHDVGEFSGGEKTQINAALRFAIAKELASMPQFGRTYGRMRTLFIDEGDLGSLDTEVSRELFVQKLFRMGEFFDKVILITHLTEVADKFPGRIRVTMTPERESRVEVQA